MSMSNFDVMSISDFDVNVFAEIQRYCTFKMIYSIYMITVQITSILDYIICKLEVTHYYNLFRTPCNVSWTFFSNFTFIYCSKCSVSNPIHTLIFVNDIDMQILYLGLQLNGSRINWECNRRDQTKYLLKPHMNWVTNLSQPLTMTWMIHMKKWQWRSPIQF